MSTDSKSKSGNISLSGVLATVVGGILVGGILWILSTLWDLQGRVSGLEIGVEDLRQIVMSKVATQTISVTYTATTTVSVYTGTITVSPPGPGIPGYPIESILAGLLLGLLLTLLIHRSVRKNRLRG